MRPFLSVIIVTYNSQEFIGDCLKSVEIAGLNAFRKAIGQERNHASECKFWETIVVDNASTDRTVEIVKGFEWVRLICNRENLGFASGVNKGARESKGEWLLLLNPDCIVDENAFAKLYEFAQKSDERIAVIGMQLINPEGTIQPSGRRFPKVWEFLLALLGFHQKMEANWFKGRDFSKLQEVEEVSGAAFAIKSKVFQQVGGMDENFFLFFEELDLCRRVRAEGWKIVYLPEAKVQHLWGASVKKVPNLARKAQKKSAIFYFHKHHGLLAAILVAIAFSLRDFAHKIRTLAKAKLISYLP
ncbi:MAG: glycosyltransferase family 2 protein [Armatimonadetes bacterium]|nr:glycosyltransferase family 2 protein [Armatimonadota bacterium]MDW8028926.1 glycosyltransferase family 2 protein [Armatimonadota bacterium]